MIKIKPYPLDLKILQILNEFKYADIEGLAGAAKEHYSIHTIRKKIKKLEDMGYICSVRDSNKKKVYSITNKGKDYIKDINLYGIPDIEYYSICLKWSNFMGGRTILKDLPEGINALNVNDNNEAFALIIENEHESLNNLKNKLEGISLGNITFTKIYIVLFNKYREELIPSKIKEIPIEVFMWGGRS